VPAPIRPPRARAFLRHASLVFAPVLALLGGAAPSDAGKPAPPPAPPPAPTPAALALAEGQGAFALDLYARLRGAPGNLVFSPYSIQTALAMARAGARGETAAQMDRVLHLPADATPEAWRLLVANVTTAPLAREWLPDGRTSDAPAYSVSVANALFGQRGLPYVPAYRALVASAYGAELRDVDFARTAAVRKEINDWVLAKTNQRIKDLIPEGLPTPDTRLALVNAIHFLAQWAEPFEETATTDADFTGAGGAKTKVRMMRTTDHFRLLDDGDVRVATLPYRGGAADMLIALPKGVDGLGAVEKGLTAERLAKWAGRGAHVELALSLPRFRFEAAIDLGEHLRALGMPDAFSPAEADFRDMADLGSDTLFLGAVLHKAFVAVDEKGTEAAAATVVMLTPTAAPGEPPPPIPFVCDHPFLFLVRHRGTGALLFVGRLAAPAPESAPTGARPPR
jgi:serpin B